MKKLRLSVIMLAACSVGNLMAQVDPTLFNSIYFTTTYSTVSCTLEDGTPSTCYEFKFYANPENGGPYCPATTSDIGGMAIYDGPSGTGLEAIDAALLALIESDGFDIVDGSGNVNINDPGPGGSMPTPGLSYCLEATEDNELELVFLIPINPEDLASVNVINNIELFGVSANGVPMNGEPPSSTSTGDVLMPALDPCGGHHDPAGYYHWHMIANSTNNVLTALSIGTTCTNFTQDPTAFMGYATDGYPIYGEQESDGSTPTGLDACNGHTDGILGYHYHAVSGTAPNTLPCLKGKSAIGNFTYSYHSALAIEENIDETVMKVYPNPANSRLLTIETKAAELFLLDNFGRLIKTIQNPSAEKVSIDVSLYANGIYFLKVVDGNTPPVVEKVIISNR